MNMISKDGRTQMIMRLTESYQENGIGDFEKGRTVELDIESSTPSHWFVGFGLGRWTYVSKDILETCPERCSNPQISWDDNFTFTLIPNRDGWASRRKPDGNHDFELTIDTNKHNSLHGCIMVHIDYGRVRFTVNPTQESDFWWHAGNRRVNHGGVMLNFDGSLSSHSFFDGEFTDTQLKNIVRDLQKVFKVLVQCYPDSIINMVNESHQNDLKWQKDLANAMTRTATLIEKGLFGAISDDDLFLIKTRISSIYSEKGKSNA